MTATAEDQATFAADAYLNREMSWLAFNFRVLAEGQNPDVPLAERLKFLAITSNNLDEFFMVRVAMVHRALAAERRRLGPDGLSPRETLEGISQHAHRMLEEQAACLEKDLRPALAKEGIHIVRQGDYTAADQSYLETQFREQVFPVLTPIAVDSGHPFPLLANCALYILLKIRPKEGVEQAFFNQTDTVLIQVPSGMNRMVRLPAEEGELRVGLLEGVIMHFSEEILGGYEIEGAYPFRVTRDADFEVDDEQAEDLMQAIEEQLRSRRKGAPIRLELGAETPEPIVSYLARSLGLEARDIYAVPTFLDLRCLFGLVGMIDKAKLCDPAWPPQPHPLLQGGEDIFEVMREHDLVLHHPYQSFDPVVTLVEQAAEDPAVLAIKITLYRVSGNSPLVQALMRAAQNGKQVTVLVELKARFDEEANIGWARRLDDAGAHVIYGVVGFKTHSKVLLVVRKESDGIRRYVHLSTGNYNDKTARIYTDIGYLTTRPPFGADVSAYFNVITGYSLPPKWNRIEMAPTGLRRRIQSLIRREIEKHTPETPGFIRGKLNSLIDPETIANLYRASQAGVRVELLVRGLCRLRPGVPGLSENIRVTSIIDRFLEHPRIYHFRNGGDEEVYCSSADWMERNFDRRLELLFPILDPEVRPQVLDILDTGLRDNVKAWVLDGEGVYRRVERDEGETPLRSQEALYTVACDAVAGRARSRKENVFRPKSRPERSSE